MFQKIIQTTPVIMHQNYLFPNQQRAQIFGTSPIILKVNLHCILLKNTKRTCWENYIKIFFLPTFPPTTPEEEMAPSLPSPFFHPSNQKRQLEAFVFVWLRTMGILANRRRTDAHVSRNAENPNSRNNCDMPRDRECSLWRARKIIADCL